MMFYILRYFPCNKTDNSDIKYTFFFSFQSPLYSPLKQESTVPFVTIAAVHHYESSSSVANTGMNQADRRGSGLGIGVNLYSSSLSPRDSRRKSSKSPDKDEARGDSGKITDISETSTTEDYATAYDNSGTDTSSKRSRQQQQSSGSKPGSKEGSSFESASSVHSFTRDDTIQAVPSSPPPIAEETSDIAETEEVQKSVDVETKEPEEKVVVVEEKEDVSVSAESSSSGSYSLDSGQREQKGEWTEQERRRIRKGFKLDLSDHSNEPENWSDAGETVEKSEEGGQHVPSPRQGKTKYTTVPVRRTQQVRISKVR